MKCKGGNNIAVIPARGGSKGLPGKNIKLLKQKPMIAYTIEAALDSQCFNTIIVSTDDEKIAKISLEYGALVPFIRPNYLATDSTSSVEVVKHALNFYHTKDIFFDTIALLQPTSPLRTAQDIKDAYKLYFKRSAKAVISVCETEHHPLWSNVIKNDLSLDKFLDKSIIGIRRQDLPKYYRLNGAIYIASVNDLLYQESFFMNNSFAYIMPQNKSVDIDSLIDFKLAEILLDE